MERREWAAVALAAGLAVFTNMTVGGSVLDTCVIGIRIILGIG